MGYRKGPVGHMKASTENKAVGYMAEGSSAYMSALHQTDSKDGVVVIGEDKSKSASEARAERLAERKQELEDAKMKKQIAKANKREELKFKQEEARAAAAAEAQRRQQKLKEKQGRITQGSEDTSTNYMRGPLNQNTDPKDGKKQKSESIGSMDFNVGSGLVEEKGGRRKEFEKAFAAARKAGLKTFTYNVGEETKKTYTTKLKGEK